MNDKIDKTIEGVEMIGEIVFLMGTTLGMVSEMSDDIMGINLYSFLYNIEILDFFLLYSTCFLLLESTKTPILI